MQTSKVYCRCAGVSLFVLFRFFCLLQCLFVLCLEHNDVSLCVLSPISDYHAAWIVVTTLTEILTSHNILPLHGTANCSLHLALEPESGASPFPFLLLLLRRHREDSTRQNTAPSS